MMRYRLVASAMVVAALAGSAVGQQVVFPTLAHVTGNSIPFGNLNSVHHQVFAAGLFTPLLGGLDAIQIEEIAFSPVSASTIGQTWIQQIEVNMGYSDKVPGAAAPTGLEVPSTGNNPSGPMTLFFTDPAFETTVLVHDPNSWAMRFVGTPFVYDPTQGNLLVEIRTDGARNPQGGLLFVSRAAGSGESSRSYEGGNFTGASPTTALRMQITYTPVSAGCYADCDTSTGVGVLDIFDFLCFGNRFSANDPYACDCDTSTGVGVCDIFDFLCFGNEFNAGCP